MDNPDGIAAQLHSILDALSALERRLDRQLGGGELSRKFDQGRSAFDFPVGLKRAQKDHPYVDREQTKFQRPTLPDPRLIRRIIRARQLRNRFFDGDLFPDPAWDMLLDLTAARAEHKRVSVTSLCIASGVPPTTALRWIGILENAGIVQRISDSDDRRRVFIALSEKGVILMAQYFALIDGCAKHLI